MNILYKSHTAVAHVIDRAHGPLVSYEVHLQCLQSLKNNIKHAIDLLFKMMLI